MSTEKWDKRYLAIAKQVAKWSKEVKTTRKVGAVLVRDNRIISTGFNGLPTGVTDTPERLENKQIKQDMVVHAEMNALVVAGERANGATLYVYGKPVCARCAASLIQAGIARVVAPKPLTELEVLAKKRIESEKNPDAEPDAREPGYVDWEKSGRTAREMFEETDIAFNGYDRIPSPIDAETKCMVDDLRSTLEKAPEAPRAPKSKFRVA